MESTAASASFLTIHQPSGPVLGPVDRTACSGVPGAFLAFGAGGDIDVAFDAAVTFERFEVGSGGLVPSIVDVDPNAPRDVLGDPTHPLQALGMLRSRLAAAEPDRLLVLPVTSPAAWKTVKTRHRVETLDVTWPDTPGLLLPEDPSSEHMLTSLTSGVEGTYLWSELLSAPRRRYKVAAQPVKGPLQRRFAVFSGDHLVGVHASSSEARRAAVELAKSSTAAAEFHVRPHLSRNEGEPFIRVQRRLVDQKAVVRVVNGELKKPEKVKIVGWLFAGRTT